MAGIFEIADTYIEQRAALDPYGATMDGIPGHDDEITDFSPTGIAARVELDRRTLQQLAEATPVSDDERLTREVMRERLGVALDLNAGGEDLAGLNVLHPPSGIIRQVFDMMPKDTATEWQAVAKRLYRVGEALAGYQAALEEGRRTGHMATVRQAQGVATQAGVWSGNGDITASYFHRMIGAFAGDEAMKQDLKAGADEAAAAYAAFGSYLRDTYAPAAPTKDGVGEARYRLHCREYSGIDIDPLETYAWGWQELYRIESEMRKTAERIKPGASVAEAVQLLNTDPERAIKGVDAYRDWLQEVHDQAVRELDGVHFEIPDKIKAIEVKIPPPGGALAPHYTGPSEDFIRPGRTWWPIGSSDVFPRWDRVSIAYHEGVPGHHLQVGGTLALGDKLSRFQRLSFNSGHGEGWALYSERLMGELGYFDNPEYYMGMLSSQALRAVRIVVDIGLHLGLAIPAGEAFHPGETWDYDLAVEFCTIRAAQTEEFMRSEVTRYLGVPAQAISYKLGERIWLKAREAAKSQQGAAFDLKHFHTVALNLGSMGLDMLEPEIMRALSK